MRWASSPPTVPGSPDGERLKCEAMRALGGTASEERTAIRSSITTPRQSHAAMGSYVGPVSVKVGWCGGGCRSATKHVSIEKVRQTASRSRLGSERGTHFSLCHTWPLVVDE